MTMVATVDFKNQDNNDGGTAYIRVVGDTVCVGFSLNTNDLEFQVTPAEAVALADALRKAAAKAEGASYVMSNQPIHSDASERFTVSRAQMIGAR